MEERFIESPELDIFSAVCGLGEIRRILQERSAVRRIQEPATLCDLRHRIAVQQNEQVVGSHIDRVAFDRVNKLHKAMGNIVVFIEFHLDRNQFVNLLDPVSESALSHRSMVDGIRDILLPDFAPKINLPLAKKAMACVL